jgi:hypothetical protein
MAKTAQAMTSPVEPMASADLGQSEHVQIGTAHSQHRSAYGQRRPAHSQQS